MNISLSVLRNRMMNLLLNVLMLLSFGATAWSQEVAATQAEIDFARDIKPIFEQSCVRCHGPQEPAGDFRIDDADSVMNYVDPGEATYSDLYLHLTGEDEYELMPPREEGGPLPSGQIDSVRQWINEGAKWPETVSIELPPAAVQEQVQAANQQVRDEQDRQQGHLTLLWEITGLLHPVLLHFPVALIIGGGIFALFGFRGESPLSDAAYYCLWLAAWTSILACVSGWSFAIDKGYTDWQRLDLQESIDIHRWGGILIAVLSFLLALMACSTRRRDPYGTGAFWKFSLILLAILTGFVAHHGGRMTHKGLHEKLQRKSEILFENLTGNSATNENQAPAADPQSGQPAPANPPTVQTPDPEAGTKSPPVPASEGDGATSGEKDGGDGKPGPDSPSSDG